MANTMGNFISVKPIRKYLKAQDGFHMRKDRILPALDRQAKERRVVWGHTFWVFWKIICAISRQQYFIVIVHMDEKWFYVMVTRSNFKVLIYIDLDSVDYYAHHKSYLEKEMYIVVTAYVLNNNDIRRGEKVIPIACMRVGRMEKAKIIHTNKFIRMKIHTIIPRI